ncbi:MAG: hypothetical protein RIC14_11425 [Filomicrobium sp.]
MPGLFGKFSLYDVLVYTIVIAVAILATRLFAPRYYDRVLAATALGGFVLFLYIVGSRVESLSLRVVLVIASGMAFYDFWLDAFSKKNNGDKA